MRKYQSITLKGLQDKVKEGVTENRSIEIVNVMKQEIADRLSSKSKVKFAPQVSWS